MGPVSTVMGRQVLVTISRNKKLQITINMAEQQKLLENTRKLLKSVLNGIGDKKGCPLHRIEQEYKALIGESIPFKKLGFRSVEEFIRDIPETVSIDESTSWKMVMA